MDAGQWFYLKLELKGNRITGAVDGRRILSAVDPQPLAEGIAGVRVWGAALDIDNLSILRGDTMEPIYDGNNYGPPEKALASLTIALFNLNEFVYVD